MISISRLAHELGIKGLRNFANSIQKLKNLVRHAQTQKRSRSKSEEKKEATKLLIKKAHQELLDFTENQMRRLTEILNKINGLRGDKLKNKNIIEAENFIEHVLRQLDQIKRRVINDEVIPHNEKVFSIFQPHTEWISKGKAGVPVEFGVKVSIIEDQYQFILGYQIMQNQQDVDVAVSIVEKTKEKFPDLNSCSFDKGYHSKENQENLKKYLKNVILPRKGKLSAEAKEIESKPEFIKHRKQHSAVESCINNLQVHGLEKCRDSGIDGFKRYVGLAIVAHHIHRIGEIRSAEIKAENKKKQGYREPIKSSPIKLAI